jgi:hypothetical protein
MKIHIGYRRTLKTKCGESVQRRWWVTATQQHTMRLKKSYGANCSKCLEVHNDK